MPPTGALIFKLEQTFFQTNVDYGEVMAVLKEGGSVEANQQAAPSVASTLLNLRTKLGKKDYGRLKRKADKATLKVEAQALAATKLLPGVVKMLESVRNTGWWVVGSSDLGRKPLSEFMRASSLSRYLNMVVARTRLDEERPLAKSLRSVKTRLRTLTNSVYFCNNSREVGEAKALGMKCFVLPSPIEPFRTLYQAGPTGIILSLEEIPPLLSFPAMKLPVLQKTAVKKRVRKGAKGVAAGVPAEG